MTIAYPRHLRSDSTPPTSAAVVPGPARRSSGAKRRRLDGPTPFSLADLTALTRSVADEVRAGRHRVELDEVDRWSARLHSDEYTDVWLISWTLEQSTELHDHAGSLGALTVVSGTVRERLWAPGTSGPSLRERDLPTDRSIGFPVGHVHDVVNPHREPAVTVHAYSPPLTAMGYYEIDGAGALRRVRTVLTDDPEPTVPTVPAATQRGAGAEPRGVR